MFWYVDLIVVFGRPFVKRFALCYQTVVLFLLSICDVGVLWPNGWMGQEETWHRCRPRSTPQTGTQLHTPEKGDTIPNFQPCLLWPKGWMDKDATCYEGRPRPRSHCVRLGPSPLPTKKEQSPQFSAHVLWPNGWMDQDASWYGGRPRPWPHCARWGPSPSIQRGTASFRPMSVVAKRLDGTRCHLVGR